MSVGNTLSFNLEMKSWRSSVGNLGSGRGEEMDQAGGHAAAKCGEILV